MAHGGQNDRWPGRDAVMLLPGRRMRLFPAMTTQGAQAGVIALAVAVTNGAWPCAA